MSGSKSKKERKEKLTATREMMESIILVKLFKDGFIKVDDSTKTAELDCRKPVISERYEEASYEDIRSIMERCATGLRMEGYQAKVKYLDTHILVKKNGNTDS